VVIDKLPFAAPSDPVLNARIQAIRTAGDDPFQVFQLPSAILNLKQGFGRLIRDAGDRGVMVLCDPRILTRSYGKAFLDSLPRVRITRRLEDVEAFFSDFSEN
jgi:ATP-dependent DNA helicase DinG